MIVSLPEPIAFMRRFAVLFLSITALSGCLNEEIYDTEEEIFASSDANLVPGLEGWYRFADQTEEVVRIHISRVSGTADNDYRITFIPTKKEEKSFSSSIRVMNLGGDIKLLEVHDLEVHDKLVYHHYLFKVTSLSSRVIRLEMLRVNDTQGQEDALARQLGITIERDKRDIGTKLIGPRFAIAQFLVGLRSMPLEFEWVHT